MTSRQVQVRMIFGADGEPMRFLFKNGGGKQTFYDCEPSNDESVDNFFREITPEVTNQTQS